MTVNMESSSNLFCFQGRQQLANHIFNQVKIFQCNIPFSLEVIEFIGKYLSCFIALSKKFHLYQADHSSNINRNHSTQKKPLDTSFTETYDMSNCWQYMYLIKAIPMSTHKKAFQGNPGKFTPFVFLVWGLSFFGNNTYLVLLILTCIYITPLPYNYASKYF